MSTTCSTFRAVYLQRMAALQKSRVDLALSLCGRERVACIIALIADLLLGKPRKEDFVANQPNRFWVTADGDLLGPMHNTLGMQWTIETGDLWVMPFQEGMYVWCNFNPVDAPDYERSFLSVHIRPDRKGVVINVRPSQDQDLRPVAMLQALLAGGLAEFFDIAGKWAYINIIVQGTSAGVMALKDHAVPLLPFASRYMVGDKVHVQIGEGPVANERAELGPGRVGRVVELKGPGHASGRN